NNNNVICNNNNNNVICNNNNNNNVICNNNNNNVICNNNNNNVICNNNKNNVICNNNKNNVICNNNNNNKNNNKSINNEESPLKRNIFVEKNENIPKLKVCKNIYEYEITNINGAKIPHFNLYTMDKNYIYKLSTVDLPIFNNPHLSILIILFDNTTLNGLIDFLSIHNISKEKFSICFWDSDILIYKNPKNQSIGILTQEDGKSLKEENTCNDIIFLNDYVLLENEQNDLKGQTTNIEHIQINAKSYNVNYVFTSKLIKNMFLNTLNLKSYKSFVFLRPDRHIISACDDNLYDHIKKINKIYI
ncbi:FAD binding domain containing protein, partial [Plasmodium malariae]